MMKTPDEIREQFTQIANEQNAACVVEAIAEVAAQLCEQNIIAEKMAYEAKRINDHAIERDANVTLKIRGHQAMLSALLFASLRLRELGEGHAIIADAIRVGEGEK